MFVYEIVTKYKFILFQLLRHCLAESKVGEDRACPSAGCDGQPFLLGATLIENNPDLQSILLVPGIGHFQMKMQFLN